MLLIIIFWPIALRELTKKVVEPTHCFSVVLYTLHPRETIRLAPLFLRAFSKCFNPPNVFSLMLLAVFMPMLQ